MNENLNEVEYIYLNDTDKIITDDGHISWDIPEITISDGEHFYLQIISAVNMRSSHMTHCLKYLIT